MAGIHWTEEEQQLVSAEGVRLWQAGKVKGLAEAFHKAQSVLPKNRRRVITTTSKVQWFVAAIKAAARPLEAPQSAERQRVAMTPPPPPQSQASQPASEQRTSKVKVFWTKAEKDVLCAEAARLIHGLEASSQRDALLKAVAVLPPERRRFPSVASAADWYPAGLRAAHIALRKQLDKQAREAEGAQLARAQEAAQPAAEPELQAAPPEVIEPMPVAMPTATSTSTGLATMLGTPWHQLRSHIVQEIAGIVAEGIRLGLESVQLTPPKADGQQAPSPARHSPFVHDGPKPRPPSVLVVGLRGGQVPQIEADFGSKLDLRFCSADESKDQLRAMTEHADMTVAVVDFISHSHTDIIKARARHYIQSNGGMTHLRQQLASIAGVQVNGHSQAAA